jgi:hypothetical protein
MNNENDNEIFNTYSDMRMNMLDLDLDEDDISIYDIIYSNHQYITDLFSEIACNTNIKKPYYNKLVLYLIFINDHYIFFHNKPQIVKIMKIMKKFIDYKLTYNGIYETNLPIESKKINKNVLDTILHSNTFISKEQSNIQISNFLYEKMLNIYNTEKQNIKLQNDDKDSINNISNQLEIIQNHISNISKISQNNIEDLQYIVKEIDNFKNNISNLYTTTCKIKENFQKIYVNKSKENNRELCRQYCRNTILLDVDLMIQTLRPDIIRLIRSFVGEEMLENIRITCVRMKYFYKSKETICNMLLKWKKKHLLNYIKDHYYMIFSFDNLGSSISNYDEENYYYMIHFYYHIHNYLYIIKNSDFPCSTRYYINSIVNNNKISEYYNFQKDVFIISNILQQK